MTDRETRFAKLAPSSAPRWRCRGYDKPPERKRVPPWVILTALQYVIVMAAALLFWGIHHYAD